MPLVVGRDSLTLPPQKDLDRILRYETQEFHRKQRTNERALTCALDSLDRLQRLRKGEYVPAPVTVTLEGPLNGNSASHCGPCCNAQGYPSALT